jgi:hypothetical protein
MTAYDEIAEVEADVECRAWLIKVLVAKEEIVTFVSSRLLGRPQGVFEEYLKGSYNFCISVGFRQWQTERHHPVSKTKSHIHRPTRGESQE